jgi:hypothetical protein
MNKAILSIFFLVIVSFSAYADTQVHGIVSLTVKNDPPVVDKIFFINNEVFEDSVIDCDATIIDEAPQIATKKYTWFVNGALVDFQDNALPSVYFKAQDSVTCQIIPHDVIQDGKGSTISVMVQAIPVSSKIAKGVLSLAGVETNAEELSALREEQGMAGVTGFVVKEIGGQTHGLAIPFLVLVLLVALLITINIVIRSSLRKRSNT